MVIFLRSQNTAFDSRLGKYIRILNGAKIPSKVIMWSRESSSDGMHKGSDCSYSREAKIGGGARNGLSILGWNIHLLRALYRLRGEYSTIHAVDLDSVLPAVLMKLVFSKKLIFDVYDKYSDSRNIGFPWCLLLDALEKFASKISDFVLLPDASRIKQLGIDSKNVKILENIPAYSRSSSSKRDFSTEGLTLGYVGVLESTHRGIEDLIELAQRNPWITLKIAGGGALQEAVLNASKRLNNLIYFGSVSPEEALNVMSSCDVIVGLYYRTNRNHFYAAPNKYYEHLLLGRPLLTTRGTPPGDKVIKYNTGYAIEEGLQELEAWLNSVDRADILNKSERAAKLWCDKYEAYFEKTFSSNYLALIKAG